MKTNKKLKRLVKDIGVESEFKEYAADWISYSKKPKTVS